MSLAVATMAVAVAALVSFGLVALTAALCGWMRRPVADEAPFSARVPGGAEPLEAPPEADPGPEAEPEAAPPAEPACPVQLMFVCNVGDALLLDGVLLGPAWSDHGLVAPGTPITLRLRVPRDMVIAAGTSNVLQRWTEDGSVVLARFREEGDGGVRTQFVHGDVRLVVDLEDVLLAPQL